MHHHCSKSALHAVQRVLSGGWVPCQLAVHQLCICMQESSWDGPQPWQPEWSRFTGIWDIIDAKLLPGDQEALQHYREFPPSLKGAPEGPVLKFLPLIRAFKEIIVQDAPLRFQSEPKAFFFDPDSGHPLWRHRLFRDFFQEVCKLLLPMRVSLSSSLIACHACRSSLLR